MPAVSAAGSTARGPPVPPRQQPPGSRADGVPAVSAAATSHAPCSGEQHPGSAAAREVHVSPAGRDQPCGGVQ